MIRGLLGRKLGMTQIFDKDGNVVPVTLIEAGPCTILELMEAPTKIKLGYGVAKSSRLKKPQEGYFKKVGVDVKKTIKEFPSTTNEEYKVGQEIKVDIFKLGDYVNVSGTSIGKGFQGGMKRWHWDGGPAGHGSMHHRRVGSIGASADPSRTFVGTHMPGQMGNKRVTVEGARVYGIDVEKNIIVLKGAVPGAKNGLVEINRSFKKAWRDLNEEKVVVVHKVNPMKQSKAKAKGKK